MAFTLLLIVSVVVAVVLSLVEGRPTVSNGIATLVIAAIVLITLTAWFHFSLATEQFLTSDIKVIDASIVSLRRRKTDVLLPAIAPFFCSGSRTSAGLASTTFRVFWQPSAGDLRGEFVTGTRSSAAWTIDDVACIDRTTKLPARALTQLSPDSVLRDATNPKDCHVFIDDGTYRMQKCVLSMWCEFIPGSKLLRLKPGDIGTRTLMLLRPCLIRIGGSANRLYRIDYTMPGTNGASYDSKPLGAASDPASDPLVTLRLESGAQWDSDGMFAPPQEGVHPIVCYYLAYEMPRAVFAGNMQKLIHSATVLVGGYTEAAAAPRVSTVYGNVTVSGNVTGSTDTGATAKVPIITIEVDRDVATITVQGGDVFRMPAGQSATVATVTDDCVVAAAISPDGVSVRRFQPLNTRCAYTLSQPRDSTAPAPDTAPALVRKLPRFASTCIPNLADLASRITGVVDSAIAMLGLDVKTMARSSSPLAKQMFMIPDPPPPTSNELKAHQALPPGAHITSKNGKYLLEYTREGNLVVSDVSNVSPVSSLFTASDDTPIWTSATGRVLARSGGGAGVCRLAATTGVLTLQDARGTVYWRSSIAPLPPAAQPYRAVISDQGAVEVWGRFGGGAYWKRDSVGDRGYAWFETCELASDAYGEANATEIQKSTLGGRISVTPWMHYDNRGGRDVLGLHWPGPPCEGG
ncbi:hypothetical protein FOA52_005826 [Chlamydomonas sp. UWO 241]|nr:hypothetical protein FOA52_005806 [Chlamydomonas sp. UWO 241]KAG1657925.1 hypothetical protein FOA52_005826 [Chlamydomonas sp. UWO 241]